MTKIQRGRIRLATSLLFSQCLAVAGSFLLAQQSLASILTIPSGDVVVTVTGVNPETQIGRTVEFKATVAANGSFGLSDATSPGVGWSLTDLDVSGNVDPFTSVNYAITNHAAATLTFTVSVTAPISPQAPLTLHGGSMGATLTDANFDGSATAATSPGIPLYRGQIDGVTVLSIYPDPYSVSATFAGQSVPVPTQNPGLPGPTLPSGPALSTIGIINQFTLTPGDMFSGNSFFVIEAVPEPSTLVLLAMSFTTLAGCRRQRR
jgi:hypothetical protein